MEIIHGTGHDVRLIYTGHTNRLESKWSYIYLIRAILVGTDLEQLYSPGCKLRKALLP